ncbi:MAG: carboxypeptidase regulatory-like domain-containing protein [Candidatus Brocadiales bacterium]|nr:carboxypeptidase regulatory-like domain-containing protein [Candidatus Brocadiales bacterium]
MIYKTVCLLIMLLLTICTTLYADTLMVEDFEERIDVKVLEMNDEYVKAIFPKRLIESINVQSKQDDKYPDTVFIGVDGKKKIIICKIGKITKNPGSITLRIPREKVTALQIDFPDSEQDMYSERQDDFSLHREESGNTPVDTEKLKEQIKDELMYALERKQEKDESEIEEKIKENLTLEFEKKQQIKEDTFEAKNYGRVSGRMLNKGKTLPGCQVKITLLEKWGLFGSPREGIRFETVTDENGHYAFDKIPPGGYKLYWKPPHESSWIRSVKMEPDFFVETGEISHVFDRETNIRTIN